MMDDENINNETTEVSYTGSDREMLASVNEKTDYLIDLFSRRLKEDRQKAEMIETLTKQAECAYIEPFIHDLILMLDRMDKVDDEFVISLREELLEILARRGVQRIDATGEFDPSVHKVVRIAENAGPDAAGIAEVIRNGYTFNGTVIRPAEVVLAER